MKPALSPKPIRARMKIRFAFAGLTAIIFHDESSMEPAACESTKKSARRKAVPRCAVTK
jgi:hypothetical protein